MATGRAKGNPTPGFWVFCWGNSFWLAAVSGMETVVPSTNFTGCPFQFHCVPAASARSATSRASLASRDSVGRLRALQ